MVKEDIIKYKEAREKQQALYKKYEEDVKPYSSIEDEFWVQLDEWFNLFCLNDEKMKELFKYKSSGCSDVDIEEDSVIFMVGEWLCGEDYSNPVMIELSTAPLLTHRINMIQKGRVNIINNKKSLWDYNPDTKTQYY